jgi:hypothetical protein
MPQQLIYTSAPRGIVAGRSGHCTVARSVSMREALMLQLEKFSYYQHLSLSGGQDRPIFYCRIVDIRGTRFHVLSRIQDAGLDFTGRTNFIAHHLVFTPEEIRQFPTPPVILRDWPGWMKSWTKEPQLLESEEWTELTALAGRTNVPAQTWQRVTGDAVNGFGLLEARAGASFRVDDLPNDTVLELVAESLEMLEVRDTRRDFRSAAWNYTFTTSMQEQDNPADFRWRCLHSDNPMASRFATPDCRALSAVRATKLTGEETAFARVGRQTPRFAKLVADKYEIQEGTGVRLEVTTDGIPTPTVRWFEIERNEAKEMVGKSGAFQILNPEGRAKRYQVQAINSSGSADSNVVEISIKAPMRVPTLSRPSAATSVQNRNETTDENPYETLNQKYENEEAKQKRKFPLLPILTILVLLAAAAAVVMWKVKQKKTNDEIKRTTAATKVTSEASTSPNNLTTPVTDRATNNPSPSTPATSLPSSDYPLPDGWTKIEVGTLLYSYAEFIPDEKQRPKFVLTASAEGFLTNGDSILFVCKTNTAKEFSASILTNDLPLALSSRGIMIRESQQAKSPFLFIGTSLRKILVCKRDAKDGLQSKEIEIAKANQGHPIILRLYQSQSEKQFVAAYKFPYAQQDETPFQELALAVKDQMLIGFGLYSGSSTNRATGHFIDATK